MEVSLLIENIISPITLAFLLGMLATLVRSDLEIPEAVVKIMAIFLLFSIGLQGGEGLATADLSALPGALGLTLSMIILLPLSCFLVARYVLRLSLADSAGVAALYGSVSSVTFVVARSFAEAQGTPMDGFVTGLVALMELAILVALFIGRLAITRQDARHDGASKNNMIKTLLAEALRGRGIMLLGGGMVIGAAIGERNFDRIEPFFVDIFRGVLVLFLLEMGMVAARHLRDFAAVGGRMVAFGVGMPLVVGFVVSGLATWVGMSLGSAFVLAVAMASASYVDAPAAVRATFPQANPSIWLTSSLGVTFPFMMILGVPTIWHMTGFWAGL